MEIRRLEVDVFLEFAVGIDGEARARLGEQRHVHDAIPDRDNLVLADPPFCRELSDDFAFPPGAYMDCHRACVDAVRIVEFIAEHRVRIEQGEGRFWALPRSPGYQDVLTLL